MKIERKEINNIKILISTYFDAWGTGRANAILKLNSGYIGIDVSSGIPGHNEPQKITITIYCPFDYVPSGSYILDEKDFSHFPEEIRLQEILNIFIENIIWLISKPEQVSQPIQTYYDNKMLKTQIEDSIIKNIKNFYIIRKTKGQLQMLQNGNIGRIEILVKNNEPTDVKIISDPKLWETLTGVSVDVLRGSGLFSKCRRALFDNKQTGYRSVAWLLNTPSNKLQNCIMKEIFFKRMQGCS